MALTFSSLLGSSTSNNTSAVTSVVNDVTANLLTSVVARLVCSMYVKNIFLSMCDVRVFLTFTVIVKILQVTRGC